MTPRPIALPAVFALALLTTLPCPAQDARPEALSRNGSFEQLDRKDAPEGWQINPSWYAKNRKAENSAWAIDTVTVFNGRHSLRFDGKGGVGMAQQVIKGQFKKGDRLRLSARVKMKDLDKGHVYVTFELKDGAKWIKGFGHGKYHRKGTSDWILYATDAVLPADGTQISILLRTSDPNTGTVWFDNVDLAPLPPEGGAPEGGAPEAGDPPKPEKQVRTDVPPGADPVGLVPIETFAGEAVAWRTGIWGAAPARPVTATRATVGGRPVVRLDLPAKGAWARRAWNFLDEARALCLRLRATEGGGRLTVLLHASDRKKYVASTPPLTTAWQDVVLPIADFTQEGGKARLSPKAYITTVLLIARKPVTVELAELRADVPPRLAIREAFSDADSGVLAPGTAPTVTASLYNSTDARQAARLAWRLRNIDGKVVASGEAPLAMPAGSLAETSFALPELASGYFSCEVAVEREGLLDHKWTGLAVVPPRANRPPARPFLGFSHFGNRPELAARLWMHRLQVAFREDTFNPAAPDNPPSDYIASHLDLARSHHMTPVAYLGMNTNPYHGGWAIAKSPDKKGLWVYRLDDIRTFVEAAVRTYGGDIRQWMPASEANLCVKRVDGGKAHYREAVRAVLETIKKADPELRTLTMNVSGSDPYQDWVFTRYIYEDVKNLVDGVYGDTYPSGHFVKEGLRASPPETHIRQHQRRLKQFIGERMTTGLSETGYQADGRLPHWDEAIRLRADYAARAPLVAASLPFVDEYMWFRLTRGVPSDTWGIMLTGGLHANPDPAVATLATAARMTYDAGAPVTVDLHERIDCTVYPTGDGAMAVLWTTAADAISFAFEGLEHAEVTAVDGSNVTPEDGKLFLTGSPAYVVLRGIAAGQLADRLKKADYSLPPVKIAFQLDEDGHVVMWIRNQTARRRLEGHATCSITPSAGKPAHAAGHRFALEPGQLVKRRMMALPAFEDPTTFTLRGSFTTADNIATRARHELRVHRVARMAKPPTVDGRLDEYDNARRIVLNRAEDVRPTDAVLPHRLWQSAADLSVQARTAWDDKFLYLAFEVTDPVHVQNFTAGDIWRNDCVHLGFDMAGDTLDPQFTGQGGQDGKNDYEIGLAGTPEGPQATMWASGPDKTMRGLLKSVDLAVVRRDGRTVYEAAIPWTELAPFKPGAGKAFGFSFVVMNSNDGGIAPYWMQLTGGICGGKDPSQYDVLLLED